MNKKLQWLQGSRLAIAGILLVVVGIFGREPGPRSFIPELAIVAGTVLALSAIYFWVMPRFVPLAARAFSQLAVDLIVVTWLVHRTGDVESPFLPLYLVVVFATSVLFGRNEVLFFGGFALLLYAITGMLAIKGVLPRGHGWRPHEDGSLAWPEFLFAVKLIAIIAVTLLSSHLAERARRSEFDLAAATKELADNRLFNDRIIESVRSGLVTTDLNGNITTFNRAAEEITGYKGQDVRGRNIFKVFGDIEKQIEVGLESIRTRSRPPRFDITCRTAGGNEIHLGFSVAPLVDESERVRGYVLTFQDLTEVMALEREVRRQERLAALGKMAAGLAHEIRNPLASMRGSVQVLASELSLSPDQMQLMDIVLRESDRLNRIVSDFLTYARPPRTERTTTELTSLLAETIALLRNSTELKAEHHLIEEYPAEPVAYYGDPNQLRQIFWNLARNAIQAMPNGGELRVKLIADLAKGITITFTDTGQGMTNEQRERLFEPFSSSTGGTGLGMAIVYQLVHDHEGKIDAESALEKGTTVSIRLPASGRVSHETAISPASASIIESSNLEEVGTV